MKFKSEIDKRTPTILAALGIAGFITSIVMAAKATPAAVDILGEQPKDSSTLEKARAVAPVYAPTVGMALVASACIVGSNNIHTYRHASLLTIYSLGEKSLQKWQTSVLDEVGKKKFEKVRERVISPEGPIPGGLLMDEDRVLFYDAYSGRYFRSDSVETIRKVINDLNDQLHSEDFVCLNDLYYLVNLPPTEFGNDVGWHISNGSIQVAYDSFLYRDKPCVSISFTLIPKKY